MASRCSAGAWAILRSSFSSRRSLAVERCTNPS
jgi:hypothetical protein